jgi:hypothetical protein
MMIQPTQAAEELVFTYGLLNASFSVSDLEALATDGTVSNSLQFYLDMAGIEPELLRQVLTTEISLSQSFVDDFMYSETGDRLLAWLTQVVHTPSRQGSVPALRSAFLLSVSNDQRISLLEMLQVYPTDRVFVDGANLIRVAQEFNESLQREVASVTE